MGSEMCIRDRFKEDLGQFADEEPADPKHDATAEDTISDGVEPLAAIAPDLEDGNRGPLVTNDESRLAVTPADGESRSRLETIPEGGVTQADTGRPQGKVNVAVQVETVEDDEDDAGNEGPKDPVITEAADHPDEVRAEEFMRSLHGDSVREGGRLPTIDTRSLLSRTFITTKDADGIQERAQIEEIVPTNELASDGRHQLFELSLIHI